MGILDEFEIGVFIFSKIAPDERYLVDFPFAQPIDKMLFVENYMGTKGV
jgi:hypothetical protein